MPEPLTSAAVRQRLLDALRLDLIGPSPEDAGLAAEVLDTSPAQQYLGGFLVPADAPDRQRGGEDTDEQLDAVIGAGAALDDDATPETAAAARRGLFPSSLGLSFLCPASADALEVTVTWGDYAPVLPGGLGAAGGAGHRDDNGDDGDEVDAIVAAAETLFGPDPDDPDGPQGPGGAAAPAPPTDAAQQKARGGARVPWQRSARAATVTVPLRVGLGPLPVPGGRGLALVSSLRPVAPGTPVPPGSLAVSLFLVNQRKAAPDRLRDAAFAFQAALCVRCPQGFVARPDLRGQDPGAAEAEWDQRVADLHYADVFEYAAGHNTSVDAAEDPDGRCRTLRTVALPTATVDKVVPAPMDGVTLAMEDLAAAATPADLDRMLGGLPARYGEWIDRQAAVAAPHDDRRRGTAETLRRDARATCGRIAEGLALLRADPDALLAFRLANRAIARALRQRACHGTGKDPATVPAPAWYPFQLAFLLLNLRGLCDPGHRDRGTVDLLFFPTGGGKTEAYLGLAAFTLVLRRLRAERREPGGRGGCGVSVLMRYTLRLLTLDQLGRAASLLCALELLRQEDPKTLGTWPFEIGLWVGQAATPNRMGKKGDGDDHSARKRTLDYRNDDKRKPAPIPVETCPWCGERFSARSFELLPNADQPTDLRVFCRGRRCPFGQIPVPIVAVDEPLYRRLPAFLIATVDKFAGLPFVGQTGALFGRVERFNKDGFYGPADAGIGAPLAGGRLPPPDLIIQDELHLISGPLGTMAGLYEAALDALCSTEKDLGEGPRPKIVASTATVRRAERQIGALFAREEVAVFPPPGPDRRDSFFARTAPASEIAPRLYAGVACPGRSLKAVLLRSYLALLGAAQRAYEDAGGDRVAQNPADPYLTLLGYFNSLRELGGSRRIVEDEVNSRLAHYGARRRRGEARGLFADRKIDHLPLELTSRVSTDQVARTKQRLALPFSADDRVDVALATNMISVGLDITRLGLMVVLGQPKTTAEYIQATSRVGRDGGRPGLVVTLLNVHRPRDRSHYERFCVFHRTFYRAVEATSVTPFSPRAVDRGLAGVTVALARHGLSAMTAPSRAMAIRQQRAALSFVGEVLGRRAERHDRLSFEEAEALRRAIKARVADLLDAWESLANYNDAHNTALQYGREIGGAQPLLRQPTDPAPGNQPESANKFRAARSLRDVEPTVHLWLRLPGGSRGPEMTDAESEER